MYKRRMRNTRRYKRKVYRSARRSYTKYSKYNNRRSIRYKYKRYDVLPLRFTTYTNITNDKENQSYTVSSGSQYWDGWSQYTKAWRYVKVQCVKIDFVPRIRSACPAELDPKIHAYQPTLWWRYMDHSTDGQTPDVREWADSKMLVLNTSRVTTIVNRYPKFTLQDTTDNVAIDISRRWLTTDQPIVYHAFMIQTNGILDDRFDLRITCYVRVKGRKGINVTNTIKSVLQPLN